MKIFWVKCPTHPKFVELCHMCATARSMNEMQADIIQKEMDRAGVPSH
jgi:hypothetical protein